MQSLDGCPADSRHGHIEHLHVRFSVEARREIDHGCAARIDASPCYPTVRCDRGHHGVDRRRTKDGLLSTRSKVRLVYQHCSRRRSLLLLLLRQTLTLPARRIRSRVSRGNAQTSQYYECRHYLSHLVEHERQDEDATTEIHHERRRSSDTVERVQEFHCQQEDQGESNRHSQQRTSRPSLRRHGVRRTR